MTLTDVPGDALYALSFPTEGSGRVPVFGERFGATIGRKGVRPFDFRTTADSNPSATGIQPSLHWFALTPGDGLVTDDGGSVPLGPTRIIHGKTEALERAGSALQQVLVRRGIPVTLMPAHPPVRNPVWSDSTEMPNHNDDLSHGTSIRFIIGGPEENVFCRRIFSQLPEESVPLIEQRMAEGTVFCCLDYDVPEGFPPVPTVVVAGHTETGTLAALKGLSDAVATTGEYSLPSKGYMGSDLPTKASNGLAVVHKGSRLASVEADGTLVLLLRHGETGALESQKAQQHRPFTTASFLLRVIGGRQICPVKATVFRRDLWLWRRTCTLPICRRSEVFWRFPIPTSL